MHAVLKNTQHHVFSENTLYAIYHIYFIYYEANLFQLIVYSLIFPAQAPFEFDQNSRVRRRSANTQMITINHN